MCTDSLFERAEELPNTSNNNVTAKQHRISVSWYCIDATRSEGIIDMLKTASAANRNEEPGIDPSLICRDNGYGDGVSISGLWEIEVNSGSDVDDILLKIRQNALSISPNFHNIFRITVEKINVKEAIKGPNYTGERGALNIEDTVGPRHLTFVTLSSVADASCVIDYLKCDSFLRQVQNKVS